MFLKNSRRDPTGPPASRGFPCHPAPPSPRPDKNFLSYDNQPAIQAPRRACRDYPSLETFLSRHSLPFHQPQPRQATRKASRQPASAGVSVTWGARITCFSMALFALNMGI